MAFTQTHKDVVSALLFTLRRDLEGAFSYIAVGENKDRGISDVYFDGVRVFRVVTNPVLGTFTYPVGQVR